MDHFLTDLRQTLRSLARQPGLVTLSVAALAMGIGFTTTMFSIVHGGLQPLPFEDPGELVVVTGTYPAGGIHRLDPYPFGYRQLAEQQQSFEGLAGFRTLAINLSGDGTRAERYSGAAITPGLQEVLGERAVLGRPFQEGDGEAGGSSVVILGHALWQNRYGGDPGIIGTDLRMNGAPRTVVGVMPEGFAFPVNADLWIPLVVDAAAPGEGSRLTVVGRLRDGVGLEAAGAEMATIARRLEREHPATHAGVGARVMPFSEIEMQPETAQILYTLLLAVSLVLLIACANVANMLLARASTRTREVAIRSALGASRVRIVAQHLAESLALAAAGGLLGLGIAHIGVRYFDRMTASILTAFWIDFRVDGTVLLFAIAAVAGAAVVAGLVPALRASKADAGASLRAASQGDGLRIGRLSRSLVVAEVALACGLLGLATVLIQGMLAIRSVDFPFDTQRVVTGQIGFPVAGLNRGEGRDRAFRELARDLEATAGVESAALTSALPGRGSGRQRFALDGEREELGTGAPTAELVFVTPGYLDVLEAGMLRGRALGWHDDAAAPRVAVVNESWVGRWSPDRDPVGRTIRFGGLDPMTVVGVVPDLQIQDPEDMPGDGVYAPLAQQRPWAVRMMVRAGPDPLRLTPALRQAVERVDPDLPLFQIATLHDAIYGDKKVLEAFGTLFLVFGLGAMFLTATGLYGVVAFAVSRRTREFGIRMAMGAGRRDVLALVLRQGFRQLGLGFAIGVFLAVGISRVFASAQDFLQPAEPVIVGAVVVTLGIAGLLALVTPARRASGIEPGEALRYE